MNDKKKMIIVKQIQKRFKTYGGDQCPFNDYLSKRLQHGPPMFACGIKVADVVEFIYDELLQEIADNWEQA